LVRQSGHVDDFPAHQLFARNLPKGRVGDEDGNNVRLSDRLHGFTERDVGQRGKLLRKGSGSENKGCPALTASTTRALLSTPITSTPRLANVAAVGKPIYPRPTTHTVLIGYSIDRRA
jgi:hypothetical protein